MIFNFEDQVGSRLEIVRVICKKIIQLCRLRQAIGTDSGLTIKLNQKLLSQMDKDSDGRVAEEEFVRVGADDDLAAGGLVGGDGHLSGMNRVVEKVARAHSSRARTKLCTAHAPAATRRRCAGGETRAAARRTAATTPSRT